MTRGRQAKHPIRVRRAELGITADELAQRTGGMLGSKTIYRLERGEVDALSISTGRFAALAEALELSEQELKQRVYPMTGSSAPVAQSPAAPDASATNPPNSIKLRRLTVGLSAADVVERTGGEISLKLLSKLENGHVDTFSLRKVKFAALATVLGLTEPELQALTGSQALDTSESPVSAAPRHTGENRLARLEQLERSVDITISKLRDELERMNDHLSALEADLEQLRGH